MQFSLDRTTRRHLLIIVAATFLAFGVVLSGYFIADDTWQLQFAYRVLHGEPGLVAGNFTHSYLSLPSMDFYRPVLGLTYLLDYAVYGLFSAGYYITNILLSALSGIALYFIARALFAAFDEDRAKTFALTSALMFVANPLHCEDICWISGRADLVAAPFFMTAILAAIFARNWKTGSVNVKFYVISLITFVLSLMSKESAVVLPMVVACLFYLRPVATPVTAGLAKLRLSGQGSRRNNSGESDSKFDTGSGNSAGANANDLNSDGKDQHIKKRKKLKGGITPSQLQKSLKKTENDDSGSDPGDSSGAGDSKINAEALIDIAKKMANQNSEPAKEKIDWPAFAKEFFLFLTPYGVLTIAYLCVRQNALGSFIGGYTGDMGAALNKWLLFRWFDPFNIFRLAFPVAKASFTVFGLTVEQTPTLTILGSIYALIMSIVIIRLITQKLNWHLPIFLCLWLLVSIVPVLNLWGLDSNLHNQRVLYLYTAPMAMLLPSIVFMPSRGDRASMQQQSFIISSDFEDFLCEICSWCFYALTGCLVVLSSLDSLNWAMAGQQIKAIKEQTTQLIENLKNGPDKKILVVRVPKDYLGAHVLMGGVNLLELLEPPFSKEHISQYMVSFQRALVGPAEPVSATKLKREVASLQVPKAYFWQPEKTKYLEVDYDRPKADKPESLIFPIATSRDDADKSCVWYPDPVKKADFTFVDGVAGLALHNLRDTGGDGLVISGLEINPLTFDYVNFMLSMPHAPPASGVYLTFDDNTDAKAPFAEKPQICKMLQLPNIQPGDVLKQTSLSIKVSHFGDWFSYSKIRRMKISFSNVSAVTISQISLWDDRRFVPQLRVTDRQPQASGEYFCDDKPVRFEVTSGLIAGVKSCQVDISKVNQSWDTFLYTDTNGHDAVISHSFSIPMVDGKGSFVLDPGFYAENGFYDVRAAMVNDKNAIVSDWSDLITIYRPDPKGAKAPFCADY